MNGEVGMNPCLELRTFSHPSESNKVFTVCDDAINLVGGTKQRLLNSLLPCLGEEEIVLVVTPLGLAQVALAKSALLFDKKATIFLVGPHTSTENENSLTSYARFYGVSIIYSSNPEKYGLHDMLEQAGVYVSEDPTNRCLLPVGLKGPPDSPTFTHFRSALLEALQHISIPPKRLWITCGTGFLCNVLHSIWPDTEYLIVLPDTTVWNKDEVSDRKHQLFYCTKQTFTENASIQPPYETVPWYDAKVWDFVLKHGENGDFVWNVGKCPQQYSPTESSTVVSTSAN